MLSDCANPATTQGPRPVLAIVSGLPATGKTTLANLLKRDLRWPLFSKDGFKELLFDADHQVREGFRREDSIRAGAQAIAIVFQAAAEVLAAGHPCIIEANFLPQLAPTDLKPLMKDANLRQVHCAVPDDVVVERYLRRAKRGERHPVHTDLDAIDNLLMRMGQGAGEPLPLEAPLLRVDTSHGYAPALESILEFLRAPSAT